MTAGEVAHPSTVSDVLEPPLGFRHEAMLYADDAEFVARAADFIGRGVSRGEAVLTVVDGRKIDLLRDALGDAAGDARFADMGDVGRNPGRIIQAWRDFVDEHGRDGTRPLRGIGEPITTQRGAEELVECHTHEALLNQAFAGAGPFWLVCPYDVTALSDDVLRTAVVNHPYVSDRAGDRASADYRYERGSHFTSPMAPAPAGAVTQRFDARGLAELRALARAVAVRAGLDDARTADFVLAVTEIATNSIMHGGGAGTARLWVEPSGCACELEDRGTFYDPLVGRLRPDPCAIGGYGLWLANQVCDLVQIRSTPTGSIVRVRMRA